MWLDCIAVIVALRGLDAINLTNGNSMKVQIIDYAYGVRLEKAGYSDRQILDVNQQEFNEVIWKLLDSGLNVMIVNDSAGFDYAICVDTRRFQQR